MYTVWSSYCIKLGFVIASVTLHQCILNLRYWLITPSENFFIAHWFEENNDKHPVAQNTV